MGERETPKKDRIKILHLIDGIGGGGSEEWVKDIVRLSDRERFQFMVVSVISGSENRFSYKDEIEKLGVKVIFLEDAESDGNASSIEKEVELIKEIMSRYSPSNPINACAGAVAYTMVDKKFMNLMRLAVNAAKLLLKLSLIVKRERVDIIHAHLFYAFMFGGIAGRLLNIPVVYTVPAMKAQLDGPFPWVFPMYRRFRFLVDAFCTGLSTEELASHCNVAPRKIIFLPTTIDLNEVEHVGRESNPIMEEFNLKDSYPILLSVGRFDPSKGHRYSLEAVRLLKSRFPSLKLIILGEGKEFDRYEEEVKSDDTIRGNVILTGFRRDLPNFYSVSDIYLRTNVIEGMNRASVLGMAYGKPMIGFDTKAPTEAVTDGRNGLLVPNEDAIGLAKAIERVAGDKKLQEQLGSNARRYSIEHQDMMITIRIFENVYSRLASGKRN